MFVNECFNIAQMLFSMCYLVQKKMKKKKLDSVALSTKQKKKIQ